LNTPAQLLALDEAALDHVEEHGGPGLLWFWESDTPWVVVGYGQSIAREVHVEACQLDGIPIFRRCSGGGTVVQGRGCLNYALALPIAADPELESITGANRWIMERQRRAIATLLSGVVTVEGHTDLAVDGRKFSGNAQRRKRTALLFHGTFLHHFDLPCIARWLAFPSAQPGYRSSRDHLEFVTNTQLDPARIEAAVRSAWSTLDHTLPDDVHVRIPTLIESRYGRAEWHASR
jgi:lipoate-protein ligase A